MNVTGYQLQFAIKEWSDRRDLANHQFTDGIYQFPGEDKPKPERAMENIQKAEDVLTQLQVAQMRYNLAVEVMVQGKSMTLAEAVKKVGGAGRVGNLWKSVLMPKRHEFSFEPMTRDENSERKVVMISTSDAMMHTKKASRYSAALRQAVQTGNATEVDIEGLDPTVFD